MFGKKLTPESNWLTILPIIITLGIIVATLGTSLTPGQQPRETLFDLFMRLDARETVTPVGDRYTIIEIDRDSLDRLGPWPWPRTQLASLVDAAKEAGAENVALTIPVEGPDPLSPEIVGRYWFENISGEDADLATAVANLPSHDVALAASLQEIPATIAIAENPVPGLTGSQGWARTKFDNANWVSPSVIQGSFANTLSLPASYPAGQLSQELATAARISVSALPADPDGIVRRMRLLWNYEGAPVPSTALGVTLLEGATIQATQHESLVHSSGHPLSSVSVNGADIKLDRQSSAILHFTQDTSVPTIPAWRAISGNESWRQAMRGKTVIIGENVTEGSRVLTARGEMTRAQLHALMAAQLQDGESVARPEWAGFLEAGLALILGVVAILSLLLFSNVISASVAAAASVILFVVTWLTFANSGILIDPLPGILAIVGSLLGYGISSLAASVIRDDAVRGAFHGALPATAMTTLQKNKNSGLLDGVRRQVTVLSCSIRLPEDLIAKFVDNPDEYILFRAQTNDKLRQTILDLGGTVDHGENGRLLGYWNAPEETRNHIEKACSCALQMIEDMNNLAQDLQRSKSAYPMARISDEGEDSAFERGYLEIGISSDVCFSGPVGRGNRNRYSVIGPSVALASRLRERSRIYGPAIICDETVFTALRHHFAFLDLDTLRVNDNPQPRQIYGLVGNPFLKASKTFRQMADTQRELVNAWRDGNLPSTGAYLKQLQDLPGTHEAFLSLYKERLHQAELEQEDAGKLSGSWDGSQQIYI